MSLNLQNPCTGTKHIIPNSCAPDFNINEAGYNQVARTTCPLLGPEWEYNPQNKFIAQECRYEIETGWRNVSGTPNGKEIVCTRKDFTGDKLKCSLQNYFFTQERNDCFSDAQQTRTCPPDTLSVQSETAQNEIFNYCTGADLEPGDSSWTRRWNPGGGCVEAIEFNLFQPPGSTVLAPPINIRQPNQLMSPAYFRNSEGFTFSLNLMTAAYERYINDGFQIGQYPGQNGFNPWQNVVYGICQNIPGICPELLDRSCAGVTQEQLTTAPFLVPFCGCYLPENEYRQYINQWGVNRECTPFCNIPTAIPPAAPGGTEQQFCTQDICIIDDFSINLINTEVGAVNINQICGGCTSANCNCLVDGVSINGYDSRIQGSISLNQDCQTRQCSVFNPQTQSYIQVPCSETDTPNSVLEQLADERSSAQTASRWKTVIIWGIVILIVFILVLIMAWIQIKITAKKLPPGGVGRTSGGYTYGINQNSGGTSSG